MNVRSEPVKLQPNLSWQSEFEETNAPAGAKEAHFIFNFKNASSNSITITQVRPSCGCTTAQLPPLPWTIQPGTGGHIGVTVNINGKFGTLFKGVVVSTGRGSQVLNVKINILQPAMQKQASLATGNTNQPADVTSQAAFDPNRERGIQMSKVDRQAIFKGDCASCHVNPGVGKYGKELYDSVCGVCHESPNRATMVPDLHHLKVPTSVDFWQTWITHGKSGTLMPAFGQTEGGPLTQSQINSISQYLVKIISSRTNQFE